MKAKRLLTVLLILMLAVPLGALAERTLVDVRIEYQTGINPDTNEPISEPWTGPFVWAYQDPVNQTGLWVQLQSYDLPQDANVRITLVYSNTDMPGEYEEYYLTNGASSWVNLSNSELLPGQYYLERNGEISNDVPPVSIVMSTNPMPTGEEPGGDGGQGDVGGGNTQTLPADHTDHVQPSQDGIGFYAAAAGNLEGHLSGNAVLALDYNALYPETYDDQGNLWLPVKLLNDDGTETPGYVMWNDVSFMSADIESNYLQQRSAAIEAARVEAERVEAERKAAEEEAARVEAERVEAERKAAEEEAARVEAERVEAERKAAEEEAARVEAERVEAERKAAEEEAARVEAARVEAEKKAAEDEAARILAESLDDDQEEVVEITPDTASHGIVLPNIINVREGPDRSSKIMTNLSKDAVVLVTETITGTNNSKWYHVTLISMDNKTGYIQADASPSLLHIMTEEEETTYLANEAAKKAAEEQAAKDAEEAAKKAAEEAAAKQAADEAAKKAAEEAAAKQAADEAAKKAAEEAAAKQAAEEAAKKAAEEAAKTPELTQTPGYMRVTGTSYAGIKIMPDYGAATLDFLASGDVVYVQGQVYDTAKTTVWASIIPVSKKTSSGYMEAQFLKAMTPSEVTAYYESLQQKQPTTPPTSAPTAGPSSFSGYALLSANNVNFRSTASTKGNVLKRLSQGTLVRVISETVADGYTWYYCESGGTLGYLRSDMLSLLTIREYQLVVTSPSYNQNGTIITPTATANTGSSGIVGTWSTPKAGSTSGITFVTLPPMASATPDPSASPDASASLDPNASPSPDASASGSPIPGLSPSPDPDATLPPLGDEAEFPTQDGGFSASGLLTAVGVLLVLGGGGLYGYSVYNKARKKQSAEQAKKLVDSKDGSAASGDRPAVRRPVPPTQTGATGAGAGTNGTSGAAKTAAGAGAGAAAGLAGAQQQKAGSNVQNGTKPGEPSPYARPQSAAPGGVKPNTQDITSSLPRAQVDGRPVNGAQTGATQRDPSAPTATPGMGQQQGQTVGTQGTGAAPTHRRQTPPPATPDSATTVIRPTSTSTGAGTGTGASDRAAATPRRQMPVAPEAVQPDDLTKTTKAAEDTADANATTTDAPPRRRRRRPAEEGTTPDQDK